MAKAKEQAPVEEQSAEQAQADQPQADSESIAALKERYEEVLSHLMLHESRLAHLEQHAHSNHELGPEAMQAISDHVMGRVHKTFGHSGMPVRGDQ